MSQHSLSGLRIVPAEIVPERNGVTVWWSNVVRRGEWTVPRIFRTFTFMGNVELDLTSAQMAPGASEIEIQCIFASVEITVPSDIRIICDGDGVAGNFEVEQVGLAIPLPPHAPTLRVFGSAWFGSVKIKVIGEPAPKWTERLKSTWNSLAG